MASCRKPDDIGAIKHFLEKINARRCQSFFPDGAATSIPWKHPAGRYDEMRVKKGG